MRLIESFIHELVAYPNATDVFNQYKDEVLANNLKEYMIYMAKLVNPNVLLVGEAPGYKGARKTGIPLTSERVISSHNHYVMKGLRKKIRIKGNESENTASIVWNVCEDLGIAPFMWNSFPFHPHSEKSHSSNRRPVRCEVLHGMEFLIKIEEIYNFSLIIGVGNSGYESARNAFPKREVLKVRHPSYGGKKDFQKGLVLSCK